MLKDDVPCKIVLGAVYELGKDWVQFFMDDELIDIT